MSPDGEQNAQSRKPGAALRGHTEYPTSCHPGKMAVFGKMSDYTGPTTAPATGPKAAKPASSKKIPAPCPFFTRLIVEGTKAILPTIATAPPPPPLFPDPHPASPVPKPALMNSSDQTSAEPNAERELVLRRVLDASRENLFRCWTEPGLITRWFTPPPFTTTHAEVDLRAGGTNLVVMRGPDGQEFPNRGVYLEVVPNERLVMTDAYTRAWEPSEKPFMTLVLTFEEAGEGRTLYTARARHWTAADREAHEKMGFHEGWGVATSQLEALARTL